MGSALSLSTELAPCCAGVPNDVVLCGASSIACMRFDFCARGAFATEQNGIARINRVNENACQFGAHLCSLVQKTSWLGAISDVDMPRRLGNNHEGARSTSFSQNVRALDILGNLSTAKQFVQQSTHRM